MPLPGLLVDRQFKPEWGRVLDGGIAGEKGIIGAWLFNEGVGTISTDVQGGNNGAFTGTTNPTWAAGPYGLEINFIAGSLQGINVGNPPILNTLQSMTIVTSYHLLTAPTGGAGYVLVGKDDATNGRSFALDVNSSGQGARFYLNGSSNGIAIEGRAPANGDDRVVVGTYDQATGALKLYIDGMLVANGTGTTAGVAVPTSTANLRFGRRDYSGAEGYLDGRLRYTYLANRAWTAEEVREQFLNPYFLLQNDSVDRFYSLAGAASQGVAALVAAASVSASATALYQAGAALTGVGLLTSAGLVVQSGTAGLVAVGVLTANGTVKYFGTANVTGVATITAGGSDASIVTRLIVVTPSTYTDMTARTGSV